ncbi:Fe2+ transport system protein FeoA [Raineyella antarctica]|uniref:Fe2+ transport system protein FeoA n=1 Tax=Raineyella antarctica TaxID=1577474 RepID=A0A1G6GEG4_9ACTN|nr:FeoA family protein [Raineyella antarctica]SDB80367.1 Fe2+ transport system protein FeoA [Raineyella antarctica]
MSQITVLLSERTVDHSPDASFEPASRGMDELLEGEVALVSRVCHGSDPAAARRLFDLGFTPGATVSKIRRAPFGGPAVYRVADYEIALRPAQARTIVVEGTYAPSSAA